MDQIILAFITGLTTGGLSCLAVQGGLLASCLAQQIEHDLRNQPPQSQKGGNEGKISPALQHRAADRALFACQTDRLHAAGCAAWDGLARS